MVHLVDITPDNWRLKLQVSEEQKTYVAGSAVLLARAYAYREWRSRAFVVCDDETPVGMGLYYDCPERNAYDFSQFFIDERYQGKGYGKAAAKAVLEAMKNAGVCIQINIRKGVFYEDESCMEGSRFLTLRRKFWRNVNGKPV